jgi:hypothetical protein
MRNRMMYVVAVGMFTLAACAENLEGEESEGVAVALNQRMFGESMQMMGGGCYLFVLGGGAQAGSGGTGVSGGLGVNTRLDTDTVVVSVHEGARTVVERRYDEAFFRSGTVDEFTAAPASGSGSLLLRYWGALPLDGSDGCAPFSDDGPP